MRQLAAQLSRDGTRDRDLRGLDSAAPRRAAPAVAGRSRAPPGGRRSAGRQAARFRFRFQPRHTPAAARAARAAIAAPPHARRAPLDRSSQRDGRSREERALQVRRAARRARAPDGRLLITALARHRESAKKKDVRTANIEAAKAVADAVRTSLGPRGMDKMVRPAAGAAMAPPIWAAADRPPWRRSGVRARWRGHHHQRWRHHSQQDDRHPAGSQDAGGARQVAGDPARPAPQRRGGVRRRPARMRAPCRRRTSWPATAPPPSPSSAARC
jgi:hypothetical protein